MTSAYFCQDQPLALKVEASFQSWHHNRWTKSTAAGYSYRNIAASLAFKFQRHIGKTYLQRLILCLDTTIYTRYKSAGTIRKENIFSPRPSKGRYLGTRTQTQQNTFLSRGCCCIKTCELLERGKRLGTSTVHTVQPSHLARVFQIYTSLFAHFSHTRIFTILSTDNIPSNLQLNVQLNALTNILLRLFALYSVHSVQCTQIL